jgi:hypothetical protein
VTVVSTMASQPPMIADEFAPVCFSISPNCNQNWRSASACGAIRAPRMGSRRPRPHAAIPSAQHGATRAGRRFRREEERSLKPAPHRRCASHAGITASSAAVRPSRIGCAAMADPPISVEPRDAPKPKTSPAQTRFPRQTFRDAACPHKQFATHPRAWSSWFAPGPSFGPMVALIVASRPDYKANHGRPSRRLCGRLALQRCQIQFSGKMRRPGTGCAA